MLDIRQIAKDPEGFRRRLARRGALPAFEDALALDARRRELIQTGDSLRNEKSVTEKGMRSADKKGPDFARFRDQMRAVAGKIKAVAQEQKQVEAELAEIMLLIPNVPDDTVPDGSSESDNVVLRAWGEKPDFDFPAVDHFTLGERLGGLDAERAVKVAAARFTFYKGAIARLERAVINLMLDMHTEEHGYTEVLPPFLVNHDSMRGTGQYPKFQEDAFEATDGLVLIPTAEVPLTNMYRGEILDEAQLPLKYTAYTPCFRREAGSYGRDTRGLIRQHQFQKVELVKFTTTEQSTAEHEGLTRNAEAVLQRLGLHYRVLDLCAGDLGQSASRTFDIEVWLPSQDTYREISSCSNCRDYQARRAAIRYRAEGQKKPQLANTLNGSGLAAGRTVVAILENYQRADGSVVVPEALRPYMGGLEFIT